MKAEAREKARVTVIEGDTGPLKAHPSPVAKPGRPRQRKQQWRRRWPQGRGEPGSGGQFHKRLGPINFAENLAAARHAVSGRTLPW